MDNPRPRFATDGPRASFDTDQRGLLDQSAASSAAPSTRTASLYTERDAPSMRTASLYTDYDGDRTPRAGSPARSIASTLGSRHHSIATASRPYKGFPSEAAYLEALSAWAEEKKYLQPTENARTLSGWYGTTTMDEFIDKHEKLPDVSLFKKWRERKAERKVDKENKRRASAAV